MAIWIPRADPILYLNEPGVSAALGYNPLLSKVSRMSAMGEWELGNVNVDGEDCCRWEDFAPDGPARLYTPASAGEQVTVISESNADNGATATGALTVKLYYLDATGAEQTETVTMNGTTGVNTVATNIRFVNDVHVATVGSNGVAEGNIAVYKTGDTIPNTLHQMIAKGGNKSLVPHRMVPLGKSLCLMGWHTEISSNDRCAMKIRSTDMYGTSVVDVFCFKDVAYISKFGSGPLVLGGTLLPALSIIKVTHWDDQSGSEGSCGWWGYLIDD